MKATGFALAACLPLLAAGGPTPAADESDVARLIAGSREHTILSTAVKEAGLADALRGKGPVTVFAPTDAAFKRLGDETITAVVKDKGRLTRLVRAHVVPGRAVHARDLAGLRGRELNGFKVAGDGKDLTIGGAKVIRADLPAANGVVHVVDAVLVPPAD